MAALSLLEDAVHSNTERVTLGSNVTIATAAYGNAETTRICLDSLFRSVTGDYELILIDDCSPDGGAIKNLFLEAKKHHANTKVFFFQENLEYSGSLNALLSHASGDWMFFVSNDIFVTPFYIRNLLAAAQSNSKLGILRGSSNFVDNGKLPTHNIQLRSPINSYAALVNFGEQMAREHGPAVLPDPFLVGDAFLVSRAVIDKIGTFDPLFFGYFADPDFGLRAQIAGFELCVVRGAFAYHQQDANFGYLPKEQRDAKLSRRWARVYENWARFKMKYGFPVSLPYQVFMSIPWAQLASSPFDRDKHYSTPGDYSRFLVQG